MIKILCSILLAVLLLAGVAGIPAAASGATSQYGLVITVDVWQSPTKLGILLDGDGGILWADFTGSAQDYAPGTVVQVGADQVASPAAPAPAGGAVRWLDYRQRSATWGLHPSLRPEYLFRHAER